MKRIFLSILFATALLMVHTSARAEYAHGKTLNLINADNRQYHFGFILGLNTMDFNVTNSGILTTQDGQLYEEGSENGEENEGQIWYGEDTKLSCGFSVGIIADLRIFSWLDLRFTPTLFFNTRELSFRNAKGEERENGTVSVQSNMMEFPLTLKFRGQRKNNYRPYLLAGGAFTVDMGRDSEAPVMLKQIDYGVEVGIGLDFYLPYFKLAPELKFYFGLGDVLERDRPEIAELSDRRFNYAMSRLTSRLIILNFNFE
ncbi:MAG: PorT family protein [Paludibacteraceae bacterium]|nr:PorT family protein [Paludibacteraceae bacterium]